MTREEALQHARKIWGPTGSIFDRRTDHVQGYINETVERAIVRIGRYWVGSSPDGTDSCFTYRNGHTWEDAFDQAALRSANKVHAGKE
jgi:hypothetical protein